MFLAHSHFNPRSCANILKRAMSVQTYHLDIDSIKLASNPDFARNDYESLRKAVGKAQVVLIGEESHGTEEFYRIRSEITKSLINNEPGFSVVLCEVDFPPFYSLNKFIGGVKSSADMSSVSVEEAMEGLKHRYPVWMWHNECTRDFLAWCKLKNQVGGTGTVNVLGLDIYSLFWSAEEVLLYLNRVDPDSAKTVRRLYSSIMSFRPRSHDYTRALMMGHVTNQANNIAQALAKLLEKEINFAFREDDGDAFFNAVENARIVGAAEEYYRASLGGGSNSWNVRDTAMVQMIEHAIQWQEKRRPGMPARVVVWAHNSHLGDASKTQHAAEGQVNVGQLVRERFGLNNSFLIGQGTYEGSVRASKMWDGLDFATDLIPSLSNSTGDTLHGVTQQLGNPNFSLIFRRNDDQALSPAELVAVKALSVPRLERFIGVQYIKRTERQSHYATCSLSSQYDAFIHLDKTTALKSLPKKAAVVNPLGPVRSKWATYEPDVSDAAESDEEE